MKAGMHQKASQCGCETRMKLQLHPCQFLNSTFGFTLRPYQFIGSILLSKPSPGFHPDFDSTFASTPDMLEERKEASDQHQHDHSYSYDATSP